LSDAASSQVVSFSEASRIVREHTDLLARNAPPSRQMVSLLQSAGRTLAESLLADRDQPPFARSTRDGFACRAADLNAGGELEVVGEVRAGAAWLPSNPSLAGAAEISAGRAVEIMTGAPVPSGADCVVMVEHVQHNVSGLSSTVRLLEGHSIEPSANIVARGAEAGAGDVILPAGTRMAAAQIGAAASCGAAEVSVFARPRVAILATGDELVELDQPPLPFQIRNSNSYSLAAQILSAGAEPLRLAIARDDREHLEALIRSGREADLLLLSGGVSMGKYDLVEEVLLSLGAEFFFTGALIQPGKPVVFGRFKGDSLTPGERPKYFFGLPGNPVSTMVTFSLFVEPFIAAMSGQCSRGPRMARATLKRAFHGKSGLTRFLPAILSADCAGVSVEAMVEPVAWQGSGDLAGASRANCFLAVPPDRSSLDVGETVTVLLA
jgi:molybdopterin molybdotransferase